MTWLLALSEIAVAAVIVKHRMWRTLPMFSMWTALSVPAIVLYDPNSSVSLHLIPMWQPVFMVLRAGVCYEVFLLCGAAMRVRERRIALVTLVLIGIAGMLTSCSNHGHVAELASWVDVRRYANIGCALFSLFCPLILWKNGTSHGGRLFRAMFRHAIVIGAMMLVYGSISAVGLRLTRLSPSTLNPWGNYWLTTNDVTNATMGILTCAWIPLVGLPLVTAMARLADQDRSA